MLTYYWSVPGVMSFFDWKNIRVVRYNRYLCIVSVKWTQYHAMN